MNARKVYQMFKDHLTRKDFHFDADDSDLSIKLIVHGEDLPQPTLIQVDEDREVVLIYSPMTTKVPEDMRTELAVAVAVANYGIVNGTFDYDITDGEIRFRICQAVRDSEMTEELIHYLLAITFSTTDKYNDRFFMLSKGMMSLEDFIRKDRE